MLSLWDAAELDAAGEDGEVLPKFINLTDASIKMVNCAACNTPFFLANLTSRLNHYLHGPLMSNHYKTFLASPPLEETDTYFISTPTTPSSSGLRVSDWRYLSTPPSRKHTPVL